MGHRVRLKPGVDLCRSRVFVTECPADRQERDSRHGEPTSERAPEVMRPEILHPRPFEEPRPGLLGLRNVPRGATPWEDPWRGLPLAPASPQDVQGGPGEGQHNRVAVL